MTKNLIKLLSKIINSSKVTTNLYYLEHEVIKYGF